MNKLYLDIETRSATDLRKSGVYVYAADPSTEILLCAYRVGLEGKTKLYYPIFNQPFPDDLRAAILDPTYQFIAHNAGFERIVFTLAGARWLPKEIHAELRKIERWSCTAARSRACGLPGALDLVATALRLNIAKDKDGYRLMLRMCKPAGLSERGNPIWHGNEADFLRLGEYCAVDVDVEIEIDQRLPELSAQERELWELTERCNDRGIAVDSKLLLKMMILAEDAVIFLNKRLAEKTNGIVSRVSDAGAIRRWLLGLGFDEIEESGVGKPVILEMLDDPDLDPLVREVLTLRLEGGKSSVAKFQSITKRMNGDGRARGALMYCGAAGSSRFSSNGIQLQNLPRQKTIKKMQEAVDDILAGVAPSQLESNYGPLMVLLSEALRPLFVAKPKHWISRGDYSQVESRVIQWLAGAEDKLANFRKYDAGLGPDVYITTASGMLGVPVEAIGKDSQERQIGKTSVLACGFQGGVKAFQRFGKMAGLQFSDEDAEKYKTLWREDNPDVVALWGKFERSAIECLNSPIGTLHEVVPGVYFKRNGLCMVLRLRSGEHLWYWYPKIEDKETPWGQVKPSVTFWSEDNLTHKWTKFSAYGGLFTAMAVQKTARDIMAHALRVMAQRNLPLILTVHDEAVAELPMLRFPTADEATEAVCAAMLDKPMWAGGLPLAVDGSSGPRYLKA